MKKQKIFIRKPIYCLDCPCLGYINYDIGYRYFCKLTGLDCTDFGKPQWCPLNLLPNAYTIQDIKTYQKQ